MTEHPIHRRNPGTQGLGTIKTTNVGAVKCANGHMYYGVDSGPCPLCGWHIGLSDEQLKEFGPLNRILSAEELVAIVRGVRHREISATAIRAASECYVPHGGDLAFLNNMVDSVAHLLDRISKVQEQIIAKKGM